MSSFSTDFKNSLDYARNPNKPRRVAARSQEIIDIANRTSDVANRTGEAHITSQLKPLVAQCQQVSQTYFDEFPKQQEEIDRRAAELAKTNTIRRIAQYSLLFVILLICMVSRQMVMALVLVVILLVARSLLKKWLLGQAKELQTRSWASTHAVMGTLGAEETYQSAATGLYGRVDNLYIQALPIQERMFEMQQRNAAKAQAQQAAHHAQVTSMHQQQMAAQQAILDEQRMQTDALMDVAYTRPKDRY